MSAGPTSVYVRVRSQGMGKKRVSGKQRRALTAALVVLREIEDFYTCIIHWYVCFAFRVGKEQLSKRIRKE